MVQLSKILLLEDKVMKVEKLKIVAVLIKSLVIKICKNNIATIWMVLLNIVGSQKALQI